MKKTTLILHEWANPHLTNLTASIITIVEGQDIIKRRLHSAKEVCADFDIELHIFTGNDFDAIMGPANAARYTCNRLFWVEERG